MTGAPPAEAPPAEARALLELAVGAASEAGQLLASWRGDGRPEVIQTKSSPTDVVTEMDRRSEALITGRIRAIRPGDTVLGEEGGQTGEGARVRWIVDPLDGTVNYLYGWPTFAVSIAVEDAAGGLAAVVLDPVRDELYSATRSGPPQRDGETVAASGCRRLDRALVGTGFGYESEVRELQAQVAAAVIPRARDIRRAGVAALDMCAVASGSLDAYYERGVKAWDIAAGTLMCQRAGLVVRTLEPSGKLPAGVVVAAPALIDELYALVV
jgi:myo-inositol-1(or 4)-monophosphatase